MKIERDAFWGPLVCRVEYIVYLAARAAIMSLPASSARALGRGLGHLSWALLRRRPAVATEQAIRALGSKGAGVARQSFVHFGEVIVEMMRADRYLSRNTWRNHVEFDGLENLDDALAMKKGVIAVGAHFGNWEVGGRVMALLGYKLTAIMRPLTNRLLDAKLNSFRVATGQSIVPKHGALREGIRVLKRGEILAMLVDQDARKDGVFVPFLGKEASTHRTPAILSLKYGAPIVSFSAPRVAGNRYRITFDKPFVAENTGDFEKDVLTTTTRFSAELDARIRQAPEQWLWAHRRWKTDPRKVASAKNHA